jgi:chromosomal replication initiation ATPase DnaA
MTPPPSVSCFAPSWNGEGTAAAPLLCPTVKTPTTSDVVVTRLAARGLLDLVDEVCTRRGVTRAEVCGHRRTRAVAAARQELWCQIRERPDRSYSYPEIGRLFGRDHSTVFYGVTAHRRRRIAAAR